MTVAGDAPREPLYGAETRKALANFRISGEPMPPAVIHWLARIKGAAAVVNGRLGELDPALASSIADAAGQVAAGTHDAEFPVDVFQTGSGTSTNMNANEVIGSLAGAHPNDHVNRGQSSNDVMPSAVHLAALDLTVHGLLPALTSLADALTAQSGALAGVVKAGRTHLMDAVPVTLGAEFAGYASQVTLGVERITATLERVGRIPLGGSAVGTGLNTHPDFAAGVRAVLAEDSGLTWIAAPADRFEAQASRDALVELSGALRTVAVSLTKIAQDLVLLSSGPRTGLREIVLPELQKGSSIMPGKVNPVIPEVVLQVCAQVIGNDTAVTVAAMQGQLELNARVPVIARNLLSSLTLLTHAVTALTDSCVAGIKADEAGTRQSAAATLASATALNPLLGYDRVAELVKEAAATGRPLREVAVAHGVDAASFDAHVDPSRIAAGNA